MVFALWGRHCHDLLQGEHPQILAQMGRVWKTRLLAYIGRNITEMTEGRKLLLTASSHVRAFDCHEN